MSLSTDERLDILEAAIRRLTEESRMLMRETAEMRKQIFIHILTLETQNQELKLLHEVMRRLFS